VRILGTRVRLGNWAPWAAVDYLVENPHSYPELTVRENQEVTRRLRSSKPPQAVDRFIERQPHGRSALVSRRSAGFALSSVGGRYLHLRCTPA
jgi:hypothetical protein